MIIKFKYIIFFFCLPIFFMTDLPEAEAQAKVIEMIKRRLFRKNKVRKVGKKLYGLGERPPLEDFTIVGGREVIGFEPSWLIAPADLNYKPQFKKNYYFNLLTGLAVGEYDIHPETGHPRNKKEFLLPEKTVIKKGEKKFNIIQYGRQFNPDLKILLPVICYGDYAGHPQISNEIYNKFFRDPAVQEIVFQNLEQYLGHLRDTFNIPEYQLGLVLDFDRIFLGSTDDRIDFITGFAQFVSNLREQFTDTEFLIYCKVDPVIPTEAYLSRQIIHEIEPLVDLFIVRGYGYEKYSEIKYKEPGPLADILPASDTLSVGLDSTVNYYVRNGIAKDKMIIEYPYYGVAWERDPETGEQKIREHAPYVSLEKIGNAISSVDPEKAHKYNKDTTFTYSTVIERGIETTFYFDSYLALDSKYAWTEDSVQLKGIGIQGLGYNYKSVNDNKNNWYVIANYFAKQKPSLGWIIASFLLAFIPISFIYAVIYYWQVRNALAKYRKYYVRWRLGLVMTSIISIICFIPEFRDWIGFLIGAALLAMFALYMLLRRLMTRMRRYTKYVIK